MGNSGIVIIVLAVVIALTTLIIFILLNSNVPVDLLNRKVEALNEPQSDSVHFNKHLSPLSGYEPDLDVDGWNDDFDYTQHHNCYDYAFNHKRHNIRSRSQPGTINGEKIEGHKYTCKAVDEKLRQDHPEIYKVGFEQPCKKNMYKIGLMVDPGFSIPLIGKTFNSDYHFMRQDSNQKWSHKSGAYPVTVLDGDDKLIYAPHKANRDFGFYNYEDMCGYYCVSTDSKNNFEQFS